MAALLFGNAQAARVPVWKAWLCFPNHPHDWCYVALPTTVVEANGKRHVVDVPVTVGDRHVLRLTYSGTPEPVPARPDVLAPFEWASRTGGSVLEQGGR